MFIGRILATVAFIATASITHSNNATAEVTVVKSGADVRVTGDGASERVTIRTIGAGLRVIGAGGTLVNGIANGTVNISDPIRHVIVQLNDGNDVVNCLNVTSPTGRLDLFTGRGADSVLVRNCDLRSLCRIITGGAGDTVRVEGLITDRNLIVATGGGPDSIEINADTEGFMKVVAGAGSNMNPATAQSDCVMLSGGSSGSFLTVVGSNGPDTIVAENFSVGGDASFVTYPGTDDIRLSNVSIAGETRALLGNDHDNFFAEDCFLLGGLDAVGLGGDDVVTVSLTTAIGPISVNGGNDNDLFFAAQCIFGDGITPTPLLVEGKNGNDTVFSTSCLFNDTIFLDGGNGVDSSATEFSTFNAPVVDINFESSASGFEWMAILVLLQSIIC